MVPVTFDMPPAARWTPAELDRILEQTLKVLNAAPGRSEEWSWPIHCAKGQAYVVGVDALPSTHRQIGISPIGLFVTNGGPFAARVTFSGDFPLGALLGWLRGPSASPAALPRRRAAAWSPVLACRGGPAPIRPRSCSRTRAAASCQFRRSSPPLPSTPCARNSRSQEAAVYRFKERRLREAGLRDAPL